MALYPPIVASSMPAFDINSKDVRIYFSLSSYNSNKKDEITFVHLTCRRQSSNVNVLQGSSIKVFDFQTVINNRSPEDIALNRYFISLNAGESNDINFQVNVVYKIQLRFSTAISGTILDTDIDKYSQWSTVCLIKPINPPVFYISEFDTGEEGEYDKTQSRNNFNSSIADFVGIYKQGDDTSTQILKSWRLKLLNGVYQQQDQIVETDILADSGEMFVTANNYFSEDNNLALECALGYELTENTQYSLLFQILTKNDYYDKKIYSFISQPNIILNLTGTLKSIINEEEGYIKLEFTSEENLPSNMVIRRTDSSSGFEKWEDLKNFYLNAQTGFNFTYYDFTPESGLLYKYLVQKRDSRGRRGTPVYDQTGFSKTTGLMVEWQHPFLLESTGNGDLEGTKQLKLKYDFQISSYKTNISESKTDTIGSKYPFIRRNGNMYYRSFPVTGTITGFMDDADLFTNITELYNGFYNQFQNFRGNYSQNGIIYSKQYDYTYERKFREKVEQFLYNSKPKLYKSMQQGNILIKLMQVSLTPKNQLGRLIYSFSATAYEVDEVTISSLNNYNFIEIGEYQPEKRNSVTIMSQISSFMSEDDPFPITDDLNRFTDQDESLVKIKGTPFKGGQDIIGTGTAAAENNIAKALKYGKTFNKEKVIGFNINWLRLTIESQPYLIIEDRAGHFRPYEDRGQDENGDGYIDNNSLPIKLPIEKQLYQIESTYGNGDQDSKNIYLGHLFNINNNQIIISYPNNIYQLDSNFILSHNSTIIPARDTLMLVDYRAEVIKEQDTSLDPKNIRIKNINGQLIGTFSESDNLVVNINYKYKYFYEEGNDRIERKISGVKSIWLDTQPGAIVKIRLSNNNQQLTYIVNETGELHFDPGVPTVYITSFKICGKRIPINLDYDENNLGQITDENDIRIKYPIEGQYYRDDNDNIKYCYSSNWIDAQIENDAFLNISCSVDALVFYYAAEESDYY